MSGTEYRKNFEIKLDENGKQIARDCSIPSPDEVIQVGLEKGLQQTVGNNAYTVTHEGYEHSLHNHSGNPTKLVPMFGS